MFLDDELLQMCIDNDADTPEKIQQLNVDLCKKCEVYYKSKLKPGITEKDTKIVLDRTFNLFNSFVKMAKNNNNFKLQLLGGLFEKHTLKNQFLSNEKINKLYNNL